MAFLALATALAAPIGQADRMRPPWAISEREHSEMRCDPTLRPRAPWRDNQRLWEEERRMPQTYQRDPRRPTPANLDAMADALLARLRGEAPQGRARTYEGCTLSNYKTLCFLTSSP